MLWVYGTNEPVQWVRKVMSEYAHSLLRRTLQMEKKKKRRRKCFSHWTRLSTDLSPVPDVFVLPSWENKTRRTKQTKPTPLQTIAREWTCHSFQITYIGRSTKTTLWKLRCSHMGIWNEQVGPGSNCIPGQWLHPPPPMFMGLATKSGLTILASFI